MTATWNTETVLALAPDPASAKAGQGLASPRKWANLGSGEGLVWGECQGSGANPYQAKIDPDGPAFSCSCPSRKFPCKHALGLMLIWASTPSAFVEAAPPPWVVSWKENREKKAEKAKEKVERVPTPVDLAAQAKREASRNAKVAAGLDDLSLWLSDLVRQGFASLGAKSQDLWDEQARRMIDAQAPGVARRLRQIDAMTLAGDGWQIELIDRLARLHLLVEGYRRMAELPPEVAEDVRATIGFPIDLDLVRAGGGVRDHWQVIGQAVTIEDRLTVSRTWMVGRATNRAALVLDFAAGGKPLETTVTAGIVIDAELAFFPGATPLRALVKERFAPSEPLSALPGGTTIVEAFAAYGSSLARNPWMELYPVVLEGVVILERDGAWSARDASGATVPLARRFGGGWRLLALEGGGPMTIFGEFDGAVLDPLSCQAGGKFLPLVTRETNPLEAASISRSVAVPLLMEATASALVGVDRRPPPAPSSAEPIGRALSGLEPQEPASRLLAIAATSSLYGRVGRKPALDPSPPPETCPPDDRPECLPTQAARLRLMLSGEHSECLSEWTTLLAGSGRRLPFDMLVEVLDRFTNHNIPVELLTPCLGRRGRWLASRNPRWRKFTGSVEYAEPETLWETGTPAERIAVLGALRRTNPERARELVASTFKTEPADKRAAFVAEFAAGLSMADEPFLESALDDRSKEVRGAAAELLKSLPESRLALRMIERTAALLSWKPGMLGIGSGRLEVQLPTSCDPSMIRDGVRPKPDSRSKLGERVWWFFEILSTTPPKSLAERLGTSATTLVKASGGNEWCDALMEGWTIAATRLRDAEWAEALLRASSWMPDPTDRTRQRELGLFELLPTRRRGEIFQRLLRDNPGPLQARHPACSLVSLLGDAMTPAIAREIIDRTRRIIDDERTEFAKPGQAATSAGRSRPIDYSTGVAIDGLALHLPLNLADEIAAGFQVGEPPHLYYETAYLAMIDRLKFRRDMHREFA